MANLAGKMKLAKALFGGGESGGSTSALTATASAASSGGAVTVTIDGQTVSVPVVGKVSSGDTVHIIVQDGKAYAVGSAGWGDSIDAQVSAVENHFWTDTSLGAVVSENEKPADVSTLTGGNTVIGSNGVAIRNGTTELAKFASNLIELGMQGVDSVIKLCGGAGFIAANYDSTWGLTKMRLYPTITQATPSKEAYAHLDIGSGKTNSWYYGDITARVGDRYDSAAGYEACIELMGRQYYSASEIAAQARIYAKSNGFAGDLYGWTAIASNIAPNSTETLDFTDRTPSELLVVGGYSNIWLSATILPTFLPTGASGDQMREFRLGGGNSSGTANHAAASVRIARASTSASCVFAPYWFYCNESDVSSSSRFWLYAR